MSELSRKYASPEAELLDKSSLAESATHREEHSVSRRPTRNRSAAFRRKLTLVARKGDGTPRELSQQFVVHSKPITQWKAQLQERATKVFAGMAAPTVPPVDLKALHAKVGGLTAENDFWLRLGFKWISRRAG